MKQEFSICKKPTLNTKHKIFWCTTAAVVVVFIWHGGFYAINAYFGLLTYDMWTRMP